MVGDVEGLSRCWDFNPSTISAAVVAARFKSVLLGLRPAPPRVVLKSVGRRSRWNVFFCYLPNGELSAAHRFTLKRLGTLRGGVLAICAAPSVDHVPRELIDRCESVCWKGLSGFDFSAFAIALQLLAEKSPGCDVFVMNDEPVPGSAMICQDSNGRGKWGAAAGNPGGKMYAYENFT